MTGVKPAMTLADSMGTDWPRVALLMLCGVFVATQVGKLPPAMPGLREHFGASLVQLGWISSVFNLVAALVALATGLVADRVGLRTMLKLPQLARRGMQECALHIAVAVGPDLRQRIGAPDKRIVLRR